MSLDEIIELKTKNFNTAMEVIDLKDKRIKQLEQAIIDLRKENNRLTIENIKYETQNFLYESFRDEGVSGSDPRAPRVDYLGQ